MRKAGPAATSALPEGGMLMDTPDTDTTMAYCASCVDDLLREEIATESDMAVLVALPASSGRICCWC